MDKNNLPVLGTDFYKKKTCGPEAYFRNKETGENVGRTVLLRIIRIDENGNQLENPIYEPDVYELVVYEEE